MHFKLIMTAQRLEKGVMLLFLSISQISHKGKKTGFKKEREVK